MILALGRPWPFLRKILFYANLNSQNSLLQTSILQNENYLAKIKSGFSPKKKSNYTNCNTFQFAYFVNILFFHSFSRLFPFKAYRKWVAKNGEEPELPGLDLSHNQLFFLNYAQIWCGSMRPEDALTKIRSSVHSPGPIRVLGPLSNSR